MVQRGERLGLTSESRQAIGIECEWFGKDFERDFTVQLAIPRPIHFAHTARPNRVGNLV